MVLLTLLRRLSFTALFAFVLLLAQSFGAATNSSITVTSSTNLNVGSIVITNATASALLGTDSGKKSTSSTLTVTEANNLHTAGLGTSATVFVVSSTNAALKGNLTLNAVTATNGVTASGVTVITGSLQIPNGASPTTDAFGEIAGDNDAWASGRGAPQWFDGTANTYLIGVLVSDTPSNGQVPTWNTDGTVTWETPSAGASGNWTASGTTNSTLSGNASAYSGTFTNSISVGSETAATFTLANGGTFTNAANSVALTNSLPVFFQSNITATASLTASGGGTLSGGFTLTTPTVNSPTVNNSTTVAPTVTFPVINYGYLGTNNTSFGFYMTGVTNSSGSTISQWAAVYVKSDGSIDLADANGSGTYPSWGLATAAINNGATGTIITMGNVRNDSWSFTPGAAVWISGTAGALTTTAPSTSGDQLQVIGKAITATQLLLRPSQDYATVQ